MTGPQTPLRTVILLGALIALPALGTDLYIPSLPALAQALAIPVVAAQFTLTTFFIGIAAGQLLWGPLSDRYGRKPVLRAGLLAMLGSSFVGIFMDSVAGVAAVRLAQGLGMSSGALIGRTIVRDLYAREEAARLLASMTIVFSLVPLLAPLIGALLVGTSDWHAIFVAMAVVAAVLLMAIPGLRETAPEERRSIHPVAIARTFGQILGDRRFVHPFLLILCAQIGILAWVSSSAFTLVRGLGVSAVAFGLMFGMVMLGQITGAWFSTRLVLRLGIPKMLRAGTGLMMAAGVAGAALAWTGVAHWLALVLPFMVFLFGTALVMPSATAAALSPFPHSAGSASSVIGAIGFTVGALLSMLLGAAFDGSARPIATAAAFAGVAAFLLERSLFRGKA